MKRRAGKCLTCRMYVAGDRHHADWCPDMPDWQADSLGKERRIVAALEYVLETGKVALQAKRDAMRTIEICGHKLGLE